jgi:hypothetical protein
MQISTYIHIHRNTHTERDAKADWQLRDKKKARSEDVQRGTDMYTYSKRKKHVQVMKVKEDKNIIWKLHRDDHISHKQTHVSER